MQVKRENGGLRVFTDQSEKALFVLNVDQFFVNSRLDMNDDRIRCRSRRHRHDRFLDRLELTSPILSNDNPRGCLTRNRNLEKQENGTGPQDRPDCPVHRFLASHQAFNSASRALRFGLFSAMVRDSSHSRFRSPRSMFEPTRMNSGNWCSSALTSTVRPPL